MFCFCLFYIQKSNKIITKKKLRLKKMHVPNCTRHPTAEGLHHAAPKPLLP